MQSNRLYTLDVFIISGSIRNKFAKKASGIIRTIEIKGNQTLEQLHDIIFEAFDREEEHLYISLIRWHARREACQPKAFARNLEVKVHLCLFDCFTDSSLIRTV